jgi:hypothetical protein
MRSRAETRMGLGAALAVAGALVMVLFSLLGWSAHPQTWAFPLAFAAGVAAGAGTALGLSGLVERRREHHV